MITDSSSIDEVGNEDKLYKAKTILKTKVMSKVKSTKLHFKKKNFFLRCEF